LTKRTDTVELHKGQISLPGGAREDGEALDATAVRETSEELGIAPDCIQLLDDALTPVYIPVSGYRVTPFVAFMPMRPQLSASAHEVVEIIETSLEFLIDERNIVEEDWEIRGFKARVPFFLINGHKVWGATAMMLSEFREMLRQVRA